MAESFSFSVSVKTTGIDHIAVLADSNSRIAHFSVITLTECFLSDFFKSFSEHCNGYNGEKVFLAKLTVKCSWVYYGVCVMFFWHLILNLYLFLWLVALDYCWKHCEGVFWAFEKPYQLTRWERVNQVLEPLLQTPTWENTCTLIVAAAEGINRTLTATLE